MRQTLDEKFDMYVESKKSISEWEYPIDNVSISTLLERLTSSGMVVDKGESLRKVEYWTHGHQIDARVPLCTPFTKQQNPGTIFYLLTGDDITVRINYKADSDESFGMRDPDRIFKGGSGNPHHLTFQITDYRGDKERVDRVKNCIMELYADKEPASGDAKKEVLL